MASPQSLVPSESSTLVGELVDSIEELRLNTHLERISPLFRVGTTKYGGRGAFSYANIPKGTVVLTCTQPLSSTIIKPFRKEVCSTCFRYDDGKNLKFKLSEVIAKETYALFFCSEQCIKEFKAQDQDSIYLRSLLLIEKAYIAVSKLPELDLKEPPKDENLQELAIKEWTNVIKWDQSVAKMKPAKKSNQIPRITEEEYSDIKYIVGVLFKMYKHPTYRKSEPQGHFLSDLSLFDTEELELNLFDILQSSEHDKVARYPYLLYSNINIYKFIRLTMPEEFQSLINPDSIRSILGKQLSNAFGIWSVTSNPTEDKEYFGYGVYPSASYFNHSCGPNIIKSRINNKLTFTTINDVQAGQELCIDYGNYLNESTETRRRELKEWFFDCGCERCTSDLALGV